MVGIFIFLCLSFLPREYMPNMAIHEKMQHVLAFSCLTLLIIGQNKKNFTYLCLLILALGGIIELMQPFMHRSAEWSDMLANSIGVFIIYLPVLCFKLIRKSR